MNTAIERDASGDSSAYNYHTPEVVVIASTYLATRHRTAFATNYDIPPFGHLTASCCAISCVHCICQKVLTYSNRCILTAQLATLGALSFVEIAPHLLYRKGVNDVDPSKGSHRIEYTPRKWHVLGAWLWGAWRNILIRNLSLESYSLRTKNRVAMTCPGYPKYQ
jgi:hypothetical protein